MEKKLTVDLRVLEEMAAQLPAYLNSEVMFWNLHTFDMPMLTLGGCFMRQHRLLALADLLDEGGLLRLKTAVSIITKTITPQTVRVEQKATEEIFIRARQFGEYLKDLRREHDAAKAGYETAVESRVIIEVLMEMLGKRPFQLDSNIPNRIESIDNLLQMQWRPDGFIWPSEWVGAYSQDTFWWLYGRPA